MKTLVDKVRIAEKELLSKALWDLLPAIPPYPPIPRSVARGIFGREFEQKFIEFKPPFRK